MGAGFEENPGGLTFSPGQVAIEPRNVTFRGFFRSRIDHLTKTGVAVRWSRNLK